MFDASRIDRFSAGFLRWLFTALLCLIGVVVAAIPIMLTLYGIVSPEPAPDEMVARNRQYAFLFLPIAVIWAVACIGGAGWLIWLIHKKARAHRNHVF